MNCDDMKDRMDGHIDGLLAAADAESVRAHAATCEACSAELRRARLFRDLLAGRGGDALRAAAARRTAEGARRIAADAERHGGRDVESPSAPAGRIRRLPRLAAAAAVVAAVAGAWMLGSAGSGPDDLGGGEIVLARGEQRIVGAGRTVVADDSARLQRTDAAGEGVRLASGAAVFEVEHGLPFAVETPQGTARVLGTCFHVAVREDRSVVVSVMNGAVRFEPKGREARQTLRAGTILEVDAQGAQRLVSRAAAADMESRVAAMTREMDELRAALDASAAAGGTTQDAPGAVLIVSSITEEQWRDLGARIRGLLSARDLEKDPRALSAMSFLFAHPEEMTRLTGSTRPFDWPVHPAVLAKTAAGFVDALAPTAEQLARDACVEEIRAAAAAFGPLSAEKRVPTESVAERVKFFGALLRTLRDRVGDVAAADVARCLLTGRDGVHVRAFPYRDSAKADLVAMWKRSLKLDEAGEARLEPLVSAYVNELLAAQDTLTARLGADEAKNVMGQREMRFPRPRKPGEADSAEGAGAAAPDPGANARREMPRWPDPTDGMTPTQVVDAAITRMDALVELATPRARFERAMVQVFGPDAVSRALWFGSGITTYRR